ncbi:MAG: hypothetical protein HY865_03100 [Chloroflexi bacterium]|nr:hypothetical protein [Chloroflexota bacterium]
MRKHILPQWQANELLLSILVVVVLAFFTYGILFGAPYSGFDFSTADGRVMTIFGTPRREPTLRPGDILQQVGNVRWLDYKTNSRQAFFGDAKKGEIVDIVVTRNGVEETIQWEFPGFTLEEFSGRFFNIWGAAYVFWLFGTVVHLSIRPKDERWMLFIAANYLTSLWFIFGSFSGTHLWESSILLRASTWLLLPVYLHLHWVFPRPFRKLPKAAWFFLYAACALPAAAEIAQALPRDLYAIPFLLALGGSLVLEIAHLIIQADQRRDVLLLGISLLVAFLPPAGLSLLVMAGTMPNVAPIALFSFPFMPLAYFYVIYRRRLGGLEVRVNRIVSLYAFLILLCTALFLIVVPVSSLNINPEAWIFFGTMLVLFAAIAGTAGFPVFQTFMEKRFFGIKLPYQNLQEIYSSRITTSTSMPSLLQLLEDEIFPSLLVRQYVFARVLNKELKILLAKNVDADQLSHKCGVDELIDQAGKFFPEILNCDWVRLILPLKVGDRFIGFWLLGQRDPDDHYPQAEIPTLQSIANQTAIALSNIEHAEQVRKMYQSDIERNEQERMSLALELHDSVLNELAILRASVGEASLPPQFQTSYEEVARRLREIVSDLRPPMLMYGLVPALNGLADNLMERSGDKVTIKADIQSGEERLPQNMEQHLYRIAQEACENSLRHSRAKNIVISGEIASRKLDLTITDDGTGFEPQTELDSLIASRHYGLAGMVERAHLLGAEINIKSMPDHGTTIHISWVNNAEQI